MKRKIEKLKRVCAEVLRRERPEDSVSITDFAMENNSSTKLRENMKRLQKEGILSPEGESSRLRLLAQRHAEPSIKLRSHQTKAERADADLKRVREQRYMQVFT
ncbi:uncharacterized protein [Erythrolamprus reginae]|uniref:uncharacterized protein isoform X2 n=1 Tax=Erythrolamprus reginae TaxID=121349 RepID=UPI00396CCA08